ncbi:hypothetical protein ACJZ2D_013859 [Fusarium nematophilum]
MSRAKVGEIPGIKVLRHLLGLGTPRDKQSIYFGQVLKTFRRNYKTADGTPGSSFMKWRDHHHQRGLSQMADDFLEKERRGPQFWPDTDGAASSAKSLRWSRDHVRIKRYVKQLFFRLNQQDAWKGPESIANKAQAAHSRGSSEQPLAVTRVQHNKTDDEDMPDSTLDSLDDPEYEDLDGFMRDAHSDPYLVPSSPHHAHNQGSTPTEHPVKSDLDDLDPFDWLGAHEVPAAPVAPMIEHSTPTMPTTEPTGTWSSRNRKPVERQGLVSSADIDMDEDSCLFSPELGDEANDSDFRPSPGPSTETAAGAAQLTAGSTMLPAPRTTDSVGARPKRRIILTYSVQISPRNYRIWDHQGTFDSMTMAEFEAHHRFHDVRMVHFLLQGSSMSWDDQVHQGDDFYFQQMKKRFKNKIRYDLAESRNNDQVVQYEILIEPVRDEESRPDFAREETICL